MGIVLKVNIKIKFMKSKNLLAISGKLGSGKDTVAQIIQYLICLDKNTLAEHQKDFIEFCQNSISNQIQSGYRIKKFADKLKDIVCLLIGCTREQLESQEFKAKELSQEWWYWKLEHDGGYGTTLIPYTTKTPPKGYEGLVLVKTNPRLLLQLIGTDCGRNIIHPQIWVNSLFADYKWDGKSMTDGWVPSFNNPDNSGGHEPAEPIMPKWIITDMRFPNELLAVEQRAGITIRVENPFIRFPDGSYRAKSKMMGDFDNEHPSETALDNSTFDHVINNDGTIEELIKKVKEILIKENIISN